ncbi:F-box/LRR-repeat protein 3 isoform X2 [Silene latifolia]|uniref:F-box/LRR-repeat protein 3 isoform X2 n=1 Tax=Silene latifolia TaxID=37657 RepID=UPI003D786314
MYTGCRQYIFRYRQIKSMSNNYNEEYSQNHNSPSLILHRLPGDLLCRIHSYLEGDPTQKTAFRQVCRTFRQVDFQCHTHLRPLHHQILLTLLPQLPSLTSLDLSNCPRVDDTFAFTLASALAQQRVRSLSLSRCTALTRVGLETLVRACGAQLENVDVSYWCRRFTDREAVAISGAVGIRDLKMDKCLSVTDVGLAQIAIGCVGLETLSLKWCMDITDIGIELLSNKCLGLKFLDISSLKITSVSLGSIASLQMLESLVMVGCTSVDDFGLHLLANGCPSLKDLTSDFLHPLKGLKHLNVFRADGARVSHSTFQILSATCRSSLVEIGLSKCTGLQDVDLVRLVSRCTNLQLLNLSCCDVVNDSTIAAIAGSCPILHCLKLESCSSMTETSLKLLGSSCVLLEELDLTDCYGINDTGLMFLSGCSKLKFLKLGLCNNITDKGLSYMASRCSEILELDLYRCPEVGDQGMVGLSMGCKKLKKLNVSYCSSLTDKGMEYIGKLEQLYDLEMRGLINITGTGLQAVASGCKRLEQLDLKQCSNIQDSGFWALANYSNNICQINLCQCSISDAAFCMVMSKLICLQDAKLVHLSNVSPGGFELGLRASGIRLKKVKLNAFLKSTLSHDILQFIWSRGCKIRWD